MEASQSSTCEPERRFLLNRPGRGVSKNSAGIIVINTGGQSWQHDGPFSGGNRTGQPGLRRQRCTLSAAVLAVGRQRSA
jgi:hypothetical protein